MAAYRQFSRLSDLLDVDASAVADGDVLQWIAAESTWQPVPMGSGGTADGVTLTSAEQDNDGYLTLAFNGFEFRVEYVPDTGTGASGVIEVQNADTAEDDGYVTLTWGSFAFQVAYEPGTGTGDTGVLLLVSEDPDTDWRLTLTWGSFAFRIPYVPVP